LGRSILEFSSEAFPNGWPCSPVDPGYGQGYGYGGKGGGSKGGGGKGGSWNDEATGELWLAGVAV